VKGKTSAMNNLATPRGGEFKVTLEDGTEVWLNAETTLRYPDTFDGNERRVEVSGEAYFKVAHDSSKPFYVVSGKQEVRVYGTEFNIHAYPDEADIYTSLVTGSISLKPVVGNGSELMLTPGHQAVFSNADASAKVRTVDTDIVTSWRSGTFVFEGQNLDQIMKTLSRWYNFEYEFTDRSLAHTEFMGSIPRYGNFGEVIEIFNRMGGISLHQYGHKVIVSPK
jgi:ferric-dicitrate binding protein FerR (iron transport regulator)